MELIYHKLPTSVFSADLNTSNILLDEQGKFVGVYHFNLCGKDVFLNYLFREIYSGDDIEAINACLDKTEFAQTRMIDFKFYMRVDEA